MKTAYVVMHVHEASTGEEDIKFIGVYSTEENAREAVSRLSCQPGFREHKEGFEVTGYEINKDHWTEGFISWAEGHESKS